MPTGFFLFFSFSFKCMTANEADLFDKIVGELIRGVGTRPGSVCARTCPATDTALNPPPKKTPGGYCSSAMSPVLLSLRSILLLFRSVSEPQASHSAKPKHCCGVAGAVATQRPLAQPLDPQGQHSRDHLSCALDRQWVVGKLLSVILFCLYPHAR